MEIILTSAYAILFMLLIRKLSFFRLEGISRNLMSFAFILKILAGAALYFIYTYYYRERHMADIFKYFDDSKIMYNALFTHPADFFSMLTGIGNDKPHFAEYYNQMQYWFRVYESNIYNDSHTIIRFNALIRLFSFGYYNVHTVFMCFFSMAGLTGMYRFFEKFCRNRSYELFFAVFLIPSVLLWSSGVLKEGILLFGLGMILWHVQLLIEKRRIWWYLFFVAGSTVLLLYTKFYVMMILIPLLAAHVWCMLTNNRLCLLKYLVAIIISIVAGLNIHHIFPEYDLVSILVQKQNDFLNLAQSVNSGSLLNMKPLEPTLLSLLSGIPAALYNSLMRPWFFEGDSVFTVLAGIENLLVLVLIIISMFFLNKKMKINSAFWFSIFFILSIYCLTGLTTPVIGAIVRYKVPALPFLLFLLVMLTDGERIRAIAARTAGRFKRKSQKT